MVLVSTTIGFLLGFQSPLNLTLLTWTLFGTYLISAGGAALNHYIERDLDPLMARTCNRPLASGRLKPHEALIFGCLLALLGLGILAHQVNFLTSLLAVITAGTYIFVYTPLKRVTWLNTLVGAIPGALPPVGGFTAASGHLGLEAWFLFAILFIWQHPHFYAIALLYKDDYASAGFKMLPCVDDKNASKTARHIIFFSCLLVPISILPATTGMFTSTTYLAGAISLSVMMLIGGIEFRRTRSRLAARSLLISSLVFIPGLFICILADLAISSWH